MGMGQAGPSVSPDSRDLPPQLLPPVLAPVTLHTAHCHLESAKCLTPATCFAVQLGNIVLLAHTWLTGFQQVRLSMKKTLAEGH